MTTTLLTGIGHLVTNDPHNGGGALGIVTDAAVVVEDAHIAWVGSAEHAPPADERVDLDGRAVIPGFVDSHAHLLFAGDRTSEFTARMAGRPYSAGGIASTVEATRAASDDALANNARRLVDEMHRSGITTFESKSGYGLTVADEARSLRIASDLTHEVTYLGAHVVPAEFRQRPDDYVHLVVDEMLTACAPYAKWIDVFCDRGAFDADQARHILRAGMERGLLPRLHANQLQHGDGVQVAVEVEAASADHCTYLTDADIEALAASDTVATLLPGAEFSTRAPYPDARRLLDAGATVALATDCNPGSSFTTSTPFAIAVAVREMQMTPDEALAAATTGGARALRRGDVGAIVPGMRADLVSLDAPSHVHLAYRPGVDLVDRVWSAGLLIHQRSSPSQIGSRA